MLPDIDLDRVVPDLFWAAFRNSGQMCIAAKRIYVHADIYDRFGDAFTTYASKVMVGDGAHAGTDLGPLQNAPQYRHVLGLVEDCRAQGYTFLTGQDGFAPDWPGYFLPVTIIDNPPDEARIVREEQFGPIVPLLRFDDIDEAIRRANDSPYGLVGSVWSGDPDRAFAVAERLDTGTVRVNEAQYMTPFQPFGRHKQSGLGVESGVEGLLEYTNIKVITVRRTAPKMPLQPAAG